MAGSVQNNRSSVEHYRIADLVRDVEAAWRTCQSEKAILMQIKKHAARAAASKDAWFEERMFKADTEQGYSLHLLHERPDHTLAIFALSWLPGTRTPPHDHGTWAVIAGLSGSETHTFWERSDDRTREGRADLRGQGVTEVGHSDVIAMPTGAIHSVSIAGPGVTTSLHIYGKHINHTNRSQYDAETSTSSPWINRIGG